jgi:hypothetical protein
VLITAEPHDTEQSWSEEFTAKTTVTMVVGINSIIQLLINEITHPRASTIIITVVSILLIFGGIQSRMNRRKWAAHIAYLEALNVDSESEEEDGEDEDEGEGIPSPVTQEEAPQRMVYEDDDIELVE